MLLIGERHPTLQRQSQSTNLTALAQPVSTTAQQRQQPANTTALQAATCDWTNTIVATTTVDDNTNSLYTATTTTITIAIQYFATTTSSWPGYTAAATNLSAITIGSTTADCRLSISSLQHRFSRPFSRYPSSHRFRSLKLSHCSRVIQPNLTGYPLQLQLSSPSYQLYPLRQRLFLHLVFLL